MKMNIKTYSELITIPTFAERVEYLKLSGIVGRDTFGYDRYLNQIFYTSPEWRRLRRDLIIRDNGCDLGVEGHDILGERIIIHHMNPITKDDIIDRTEYLMNPNYLICTRQLTHNLIHYGDDYAPINSIVERAPNDTCPWKR